MADDNIPVIVLPDKRRQLHVTGIDLASGCGVAFERRYIRGETRRPGISLHVGRSGHGAIAFNLNHKIATGELCSVKDVKDYAAQHYDDLRKDDPIEQTDEDKEDGLTVDAGRDKVVELAGLHAEKVAPLLQPAAVERSFTLDIDEYLRDRAKYFHEIADESRGWLKRTMQLRGRAHNAIAKQGLDLAGRIDIMEQYETPLGDLSSDPTQLIIRDTKLKKKSPTADDAYNSNQIACYSLATKIIDGKVPNGAHLDCLIETPKQKKRYVKTVSTQPTEDDIDVFLNRLSATVVALHSGIFLPARLDDWRCSKRWCGYWSDCKYARHPKTTSGLVTISTTAEE